MTLDRSVSVAACVEKSANARDARCAMRLLAKRPARDAQGCIAMTAGSESTTSIQQFRHYESALSAVASGPKRPALAVSQSAVRPSAVVDGVMAAWLGRCRAIDAALRLFLTLGKAGFARHVPCGGRRPATLCFAWRAERHSHASLVVRSAIAVARASTGRNERHLPASIAASRSADASLGRMINGNTAGSSAIGMLME